MLNEHTLNQLRALRLDGMVAALNDAATHITASELPFEQRLALLVQREVDWRDGKRLQRLLKTARLKVSSACLEDIDWRASRGLNREVFASLAGGDWLRHGHSILLTGATGCGKTWLACALGQQAARLGFSVLYTRAPRLLEELHVAHGDGSFSKRLAQLARLDLLILDDFAIAPIAAHERNDLLELLDDRVGTRSTLITSQLPVAAWHAWLDEPTLADAILDRIVHGSHTLCIGRAIGTYMIQALAVSVGHRQPIGVGAGGLAMLAEMPVRDADALIRANRERLPYYRNLTMAALRGMVAQARSDGYAVIGNYAVSGVVGVGVAFRDPMGNIIGGVSVASIKSRMGKERQEHVARQMRELIEQR